ncbi:Fur family transcriptional regulator [Chitinilyticum piscinae]|uniref:Transcriptional repressor n=1 Tax=Chitinilyticum piscinae TaxID=2866724 RepID=A0A8J7FL00_9NEIS|nr:transcriptional repressor [Chitinilyticum piscinae]MBE9608116.1 transcriptional repressor [Chitinilyticum piscinae]
MLQPAPERIAEARRLVTAAAGRCTAMRVSVLAILLASPRPLSHPDILAALGDGIDRVTVYRVLDWLTEQALAHKLAGDDRVWRFAAAAATPHRHAHFHCSHCGRFFCLEQMSTELPVFLPAGFRAQQLEITIKGLCADCCQSG